MRAPIVVFAVGNRARGDDALGPLLGERLAREAPAGVEIIILQQLQVEQALDLEGRELAVFIDAAVDLATPCRIAPVEVTGCLPPFTHALPPPALLDTAQRVLDAGPPPAVTCSVRGERFELGEPLSASAREALEAAWPALVELLAAQAERPPGHREAEAPP